MTRTAVPLFCRTCEGLRLVLARVQTLRRPFAPQHEDVRLVYVCRACGTVVASASVS